ncbi:hypothetical protein JXM83_03040 [Candidatus Woesearchaeota archaeon]|nr:hypothetical protein [Candidatus Woesearchaeota archaeon]
MKKFSFLIVIFLLVQGAFAGTLVTQPVLPVCGSPYLNLSIYSEESLHLFQLGIDLEQTSHEFPSFGSRINGTGFFNEENNFRDFPTAIEYFEMNSTNMEGNVIVELINDSAKDRKLKPGYYYMYLLPTVQQEDDSYLDFQPRNFMFTLNSKLDDLEYDIFDRNGNRNNFVMGEKLSVNISNIFSESYGYIDLDIYYSQDLDHPFYWKKLLATESNPGMTYRYKNFDNVIETMLYDTQDNYYCPRDDIIIRFRDYCGVVDIPISQVPPKPSDIYFHVDEFFDNMNISKIPQIYYMAGAYFNCLSDSAPSNL